MSCGAGVSSDDQKKAEELEAVGLGSPHVCAPFPPHIENQASLYFLQNHQGKTDMFKAFCHQGKYMMDENEGDDH